MKEYTYYFADGSEVIEGEKKVIGWEVFMQFELTEQVA